jgi:hypothetical protein
MFFEDWTDSICNNEVAYSIVAIDGTGLTAWNEIIRVDFANEEDATILKLKGIPDEFSSYLEILNQDCLTFQ